MESNCIWYNWYEKVDGVTSFVPRKAQNKRIAYTHSYPLPAFLVMQEPYCKISDGAKIIYANMLAYMHDNIADYIESKERDFIDNNNILFIEYTVNEVKETLCCSTSKAIKCLRELEAVHLIKRRRRGLGQPDAIYLYIPLIDERS